MINAASTVPASGNRMLPADLQKDIKSAGRKPGLREAFKNMISETYAPMCICEGNGTLPGYRYNGRGVPV